MSSGRSVTLNTGHQMPQLGYGTWQAEPGEVAAGVLEALRTGYRHLDLAKVYGNQAEVAIGLRRGLAEIPGLDRGQLFITSKLWNTKHRPADVEAALDDTLAELQLDYLDLYLIHWPVAFRPGDETHPTTTGNPDKIDLDRSVSVCQTWKAIIQLPKSKVRSVGVSNFSIKHLEAVIQDSGVVPAVNQIERHPRLPNTALLDYCIAKKSSPLPIRPLATTALACRCSSPTPKSRLKPPGSPSRPPSLSSLGVSRAATPSSPSPSPLTASARTSRMSPSTALPSLPLPGSVRSLSASTCPASMRPFGTSTSSTRTWKSPPPTRSSSSSRHTWPWMTLDTA